MSDLEQQLTGTLARVAEDAPGAVGLADAARRRHRVRRQRRLALGAGAAALVVGVGAVVVGAMGGEDRGADPVDDPSPESWQTVEVDGGAAFVSIPPEWAPYSCGSEEDAEPVFALSEADACTNSVGAIFLPAGARNEQEQGAVVSGDGGWLGYVTAGAFEVRAFHPDEALVRRILATARVSGQPAVDASTWVRFDRDGLAYEVPAWWGLGEDADRSDYSVCLLPPGTPGGADASGDGYVLTEQPGPEGVVRVAAPTQALAELVMSTVDASEAIAGGDCTPEDFATGLLPGEAEPRAVETSAVPVLVDAAHDGIRFSVLDTWREKSCGGFVQFTPGAGCRSIQQSDGLQFLDARTLQPTMEEGVLVLGGSGGTRLWGGYVRRGRHAIWVTHPDRETAQVLLDMVR